MFIAWIEQVYQMISFEFTELANSLDLLKLMLIIFYKGAF